jgi:hypothetical protein
MYVGVLGVAARPQCQDNLAAGERWVVIGVSRDDDLRCGVISLATCLTRAPCEGQKRCLSMTQGGDLLRAGDRSPRSWASCHTLCHRDGPQVHRPVAAARREAPPSPRGQPAPGVDAMRIRRAPECVLTDRSPSR